MHVAQRQTGIPFSFLGGLLFSSMSAAKFQSPEILGRVPRTLKTMGGIAAFTIVGNFEKGIFYVFISDLNFFRGQTYLAKRTQSSKYYFLKIDNK